MRRNIVHFHEKLFKCVTRHTFLIFLWLRVFEKGVGCEKCEYVGCGSESVRGVREKCEECKCVWDMRRKLWRVVRVNAKGYHQCERKNMRSVRVKL